MARRTTDLHGEGDLRGRLHRDGSGDADHRPIERLRGCCLIQDKSQAEGGKNRPGEPPPSPTKPASRLRLVQHDGHP
jgi:hypothetical protein